MILDQWGQPWKFAHGADRDRRRGPQYQDRTADFHKLIPNFDARNIRSLSSRLYTNMGVPRACVQQKADYAIGDAWRPTYSGESDFKDGKQIGRFLTKVWFPSCDVRGGCFDWHKLLELTSIAIDRDGDAFWLLVKGSDNFPRIQQMPAHRCGNGRDGDTVSTGLWKGYDLRDGVIQTKEGRAVAYRFLTGERMDIPMDVDAKNVIHIFDPAYQDQSRGLPAFTHALEHLKSMLAATADERQRQQIVSRLYLTVFNENGGPDMDDPLMSIRPEGASGNPAVLAQEIAGGITYLTAGSGEKIEQMPHATPGDMWENFQDRLTREAVASVWVYALVWKSPGQGTAERSEVLKARRLVVRRQKQLRYAARRALAWAYSVFVETKRVPLLDHPFAWEFSLPPRLTVDDGREAKMEMDEWAAGLRNTGDIVQAKLGMTEDEFHLARAHSIASRKVIAKQVAEEYSASSGYEIEICDTEMALLNANQLMANVQMKQVDIQEDAAETTDPNEDETGKD